MDNDEPPASFDSDKGEFEIELKKVQAGEEFPDLDLLGTLLAPKRTQQNIKPTIEVVSGKYTRRKNVIDISQKNLFQLNYF